MVGEVPRRLVLILDSLLVRFREKFTPSEVAHYVKAYSTAAQLHAAFEMYRAFPANEKFNQGQRGPNDVPLFVGAGDGSPFAKLIPKMLKVCGPTAALMSKLG